MRKKPLQNDAEVVQSRKAQSIAKSSAYLTAALLLCKILAFIRDALISRQFGATVEVDAFLAGATVISLFTTVVTSSLGKCFIPFLSEYYRIEEKDKGNAFIGSVYGWATILGAVLTTVTIVFNKQIVDFTLPGMNDDGKEVLSKIVYIQAPCILALILRGVNRGILQYNNRFASVELLSYLGIIFTIMYTLFVKDCSVYGMAVAFTLGSITTMIIQFIMVRKDGYSIKLLFKINPTIRKLALAMLAFSIAGGAREINGVVSKAIASLIGEGSITMLSYANKLTVTEVGLVSSAICTVSFSYISKAWSRNDKASVKKSISSSFMLINTLFYLLVPISIAGRSQIIELIYGGGQFNASNVRQTANAMMFYTLGLYGFGFQDVLTYTLNATKKTKYSVISSVTVVALNIILSLTLYKQYGINALAIASSLSVLLVIAPLYILCSRDVVNLKGSGIVLDTGKLLVASVGSLIVASVVRKVLSECGCNNLLLLFAIAIAALLTYCIILILERSPAIRAIIEIICSAKEKNK